jgi:solute carrier family 27 fatty acid transporter 1/4
MSLGVYHIQALKSDDIVYCPLPLYHSAGGALGMGQALLSGITVVIRRKFSASQYIPDCVQHNCTVRLQDPVLVHVLLACQLCSFEL